MRERREQRGERVTGARGACSRGSAFRRFVSWFSLAWWASFRDSDSTACGVSEQLSDPFTVHAGRSTCYTRPPGAFSTAPGACSVLPPIGASLLPRPRLGP